MNKSDIQHWLKKTGCVFVDYGYGYNKKFGCETYTLRIGTHPMRTKQGFVRTRKLFETDNLEALKKWVSEFGEKHKEALGYFMVDNRSGQQVELLGKKIDTGFQTYIANNEVIRVTEV